LRSTSRISARLACLCFALCVLAGFLPAQVQIAWTQTWDDQWNANDRCMAIATDDAGNVYVAGYAGGIDSTDRSFLAIKYTPDGSEVWERQYNPTPAWDAPTAMVLDRDHNMILAGYAGGNLVTNGDWAIVKYSSAGDSLWSQTYSYGTADRANALAVDDAGNIYVTGELGAYPNLDCVTIKYSAAGVPQWVAEYYGSGMPLVRGQAIALDPQGNSYVAGASFASSWDILLIKYDPQGDTVWTAAYDGPAQKNDISAAVVVDQTGNSYVGGQSTAANVSPDCLTVKFDPQGDTVWTRRYDGPGQTFDAVRAMVLDPAGGVRVTGVSNGTRNQADVITIKYLADGTVGWGTRYNAPGNYPDQGNAIALDGLGNTYVAGASWGSNQNNDGICLRYDTLGRQRGLARFSQNTSEFYSAVAVDPSNQVICGGYTRPFSDDILVIKYRQITGLEEGNEPPAARDTRAAATLARGVLNVPASRSGRNAPSTLLNAAGREAAKLRPGANDIHSLAPGVYFVSAPDSPQTAAKVVIAR
jgi:uncharacterized delta-60 repeat protein